jgi:hypothetical protein
LTPSMATSEDAYRPAEPLRLLVAFIYSGAVGSTPA